MRGIVISPRTTRTTTTASSSSRPMARSSTTRPSWRSKPRSNSRSAPCPRNSSARPCASRDAVGRYVEVLQGIGAQALRPARHAHRDRLRQRRDLPDRRRLVLRELGAQVSDRRGAGRTQHQRRRRLDPSGEPERTRARDRRRPRHRIRWRRRPRAVRRSPTARSAMATTCSTCWRPTGSSSGRLRGPVVGTLMTNYGFERALARTRHRVPSAPRSATATCTRRC